MTHLITPLLYRVENSFLGLEEGAVHWACAPTAHRSPKNWLVEAPEHCLSADDLWHRRALALNPRPGSNPSAPKQNITHMYIL